MTTTTGKDEERGSCEVVTYLYDFTEAEVEKLMERIGDVLVEELGVIATEHDPVRALVGLKPRPFPDLRDEAEAQEFIKDHVQILILNSTSE